MRTPSRRLLAAPKSPRDERTGRIVAPAVINRVSGPRDWRWAKPRARNDARAGSRSDTAKYTAASSSSIGIPFGIDSQRPNISTDRNEAAADVHPTIAIVG